jgi:mono/diheme cytochrome c family protein
MRQSRRGRTALVVAGLLALGACSDHEFHPPDREGRVAEAQERFQDARFDTLAWDSDDARIQAGNLVFADECRRCHGPLGRGDTDYARQNDLEVASLVEPGWEFADDLDGVRRRIYVGHAEGMPNWGVGKLTERQIDAVAFYILEQLRPEILEATETAPGEAPGSPPERP